MPSARSSAARPSEPSVARCRFAPRCSGRRSPCCRPRDCTPAPGLTVDEVAGGEDVGDGRRAYSGAVVLRVVFAEDNLLVREGVAALLSETDDIELVATVTDPGSLLEAVAEHRPDAVLTDIRMPPTFTTEGIDAAKRIRAGHPATGVVVLSQYVEEEYAFALLSEGVAGLGYLLKERVSQGDDLVRALHDVARGAGVAVTVARTHRPRARGARGDGGRAQQLGDGEGAVHE